MPGPKNRSEALGDDAGVHQTRNRTRLATAREVEVTSRDRTLRFLRVSPFFRSSLGSQLAHLEV